MKQAVLLIDCYLYGTIAILAVVLLVLVYPVSYTHLTLPTKALV